MTKPKLAIVILHFGEQDQTLQCLRSVTLATRAAQNVCMTSTYIVDNSAATNPFQAGNSVSGDANIIRSSSNSGFAVGMNLGIEAATQKPCDYLWLLNNDTIVEQSSITTLIEHAQTHPEQKWIGCTMLDWATHRITTTGGYRYYPILSIARPLKNSSSRPDYIDGAAMLLCAETARLLNGLPVNNFMYFEELHLARALQDAGFSWGVCEAARVMHMGGASTRALGADQRVYFVTRAALQYTRQHTPVFTATVWLTRFIKAIFDSAVAGDMSGLRGFFRATTHHCSRHRHDGGMA